MSSPILKLVLLLNLAVNSALARNRLCEVRPTIGFGYKPQTRYYYNTLLKSCQPYTYYGGPNIVENNFKSQLGRLNNKQLCAGSIIGKQWIVTAAHCLKDPPYRLIITGGTQTTNFTDSPTAQTRRCDFYRRHEQYSTIFGATGGYDVGVAHISVPFEFTKFVQPIEMREDLNFSRSVCIFGWGSTSKTADRDYPDTLQVANLTLADVKVCEMEHNTTIGVGTLCAGGSVDNKGACIGDSGGPLVQNGALVGLVSWGPPTCNPEHAPTIFTSVGYYIDWIRKQLQTDVDNDNLLK